MSEARERSHHTAGVARLAHVRAEPLGAQEARATVLDHRIDALPQTQEEITTLRLAHVQGDGALAAVGVLERERGLTLGRGAVAVVVARPGPLHLDHVGPEVREHRGGERPRDHAGEVQDADAFEYAASHGTSRVPPHFSKSMTPERTLMFHILRPLGYEIAVGDEESPV